MAGLALPRVEAGRDGHQKTVLSLLSCRVFIFQPLLHLGGAT